MQAAGGAALTTNDSLAARDTCGDDGAAGGTRASARTVRVVLLGIAVFVVAVDLVTKHLAVSRLDGRPPVRLFGGAVYLLLTRNSGAAFSFAARYTFVFSIIAVAVIGWIIWMMLRLRSPGWAVALGFVLGGTLGNLIDRVFRAPRPFSGHVVDFISLFDAAGQGFPVFNAADSALCLGVGLAIFLELTGRRRDGTRASASPPDASPRPDDSSRDG